jgi:hypothetical protein
MENQQVVLAALERRAQQAEIESEASKQQYVSLFEKGLEMQK